ncbi:hypothetical protein [Helicobacter canis]|uniref:hypothetical protein n=1 Tax=Helicobacter canis TaxID=29419 RepID=UPI0015EFF09D|nr:hypothetical protein [Helicobacter canis]
MRDGIASKKWILVKRPFFTSTLPISVIASFAPQSVAIHKGAKVDSSVKMDY